MNNQKIDATNGKLVSNVRGTWDRSGGPRRGVRIVALAIRFGHQGAVGAFVSGRILSMPSSIARASKRSSIAEYRSMISS